MRRLNWIVGVVAGLAISACGGGASPTPGVTFRAPSAAPTAEGTPVVTPAPTAAPTSAPTPEPTVAPGGPTAKVTIFDNGFTVGDLTVAQGTTITWLNTGRRAHTVTATDASFGSDGALGGGDTYMHTFETAGTFTYICTIHNDMSGSITVTP